MGEIKQDVWSEFTVDTQYRFYQKLSRKGGLGPPPSSFYCGPTANGEVRGGEWWFTTANGILGYESGLVKGLLSRDQ